MSKLTNLDISTFYRNKEYWFVRNDFLGAFAYWVVYQSPYDAPDITEALTAFEEYVARKIYKGIPKQFTYNELSEFINEDVLESIPAIEKLNHAKKGNDFISLGALARNIFYMLLREYITQS